MASVFTEYDTYRTGASLSYPIVMKSPYADWSSLIIRVKVKNASELFIGAFCEQADSGTWGVVEKTSDKSLKVLGIVLDTVANKKQLSTDNNGAAPNKTLFFAANSYIDILPLIPGFVLSVRIKASVSALDEGEYICSTADSDGRKLAAIASDVDPSARLGRNIGGMNTNGTGVQYTAMAVV
jgi:hypothetical protein